MKKGRRFRTARAVLAAHEKLTDVELLAAIGQLDLHERTLLLPCPAKTCGAAEGEACRGLERGIVHFGRRVNALRKGLHMVPGA